MSMGFRILNLRALRFVRGFYHQQMESEPIRRKRPAKPRHENNELFLEPDFTEDQVSIATLWRWNKLAKVGSQAVVPLNHSRPERNILLNNDLDMNGRRNSPNELQGSHADVASNRFLFDPKNSTNNNLDVNYDRNSSSVLQGEHHKNGVFNGDIVFNEYMEHSGDLSDEGRSCSNEGGLHTTTSTAHHDHNHSTIIAGSVHHNESSIETASGVFEESDENLTVSMGSQHNDSSGSQKYPADDECSDTYSTTRWHVENEPGNEYESVLSNQASSVVTQDCIRVRQTDDTVMFPQSEFTVHEVGAALTAISLRHHISYEGTTDIGNLVKVLAGDRFNDKSLFNKYYMQKNYNYDKKGVLEYLFYCQDCENCIIHVTSQDKMTPIHVICKKCSHEQDISFKSRNYFISIDLAHQFHHLLQSKKTREQIIVASVIAKQKARSTDASMSSGSHGDLYKRLPINDPRVIIGLSASTDGAPIAENSVEAMWPVTVRINELSTPESSSHCILCGMLVVDKEPSSKLLNLYLDKVLVENLAPLSDEGLTYKDEFQEITFVIYVINFSLDSKARPVVQHRKQYNARFGCSWCYAEGEHIDCWKYPFSHAFAELRTEESHKRDIDMALQTLKPYHGVIGDFSSRKLKFLDPVWAFSFDDLHGGYLGTTKYLWETWNKTSCKFYLKPKHRREINARISKVQLPSDIERDFRPFRPKVKHKGLEWCVWLLFLCVICLKDIIDPVRLEHLCLMVKSFWTLSQDEVLAEECSECHKMLNEFVGMCEILYGKSFMTFNVHSLTHAAVSVKKSGAFWTTSTFPPESFMHGLQLNKTSPKSAGKQIVNRYLQNNFLRWSIYPEMDKTKSSTQFLESILFKNHYAKNGLDSFSLSHSMMVDDTLAYNRCVNSGVIYTSTEYSENVKKNDCIVQTEDADIIQILYFYKREDECLVKVQKYVSSRLRIGKVEMPHIYRLHELLPSKYSLCLSKIRRKCVFLNMSPDERYVAVLPSKLNGK